MAIDSGLPEIAHQSTPVFDPSALVTKKPSALPLVYDYIVNHEPATPNAIQQGLDISKSVTFSTLDKLQDIGLVKKIEHGVYESADIALDPTSVHALGELRSKKQYEICDFAAEVESFDVAELRHHVSGSRSNLRAAAVRLHEKDFLDQTWEPFDKSPKQYRVTEKAKQALSALDVEKYLDRDWREVVAYADGIEGTDFLTAYEIEDAYYLTQSDDRWMTPEELADALDKNWKKTLRRFSKMEERDLITGKALREKMIFKATNKTHSLFRDLKLYTISKNHNLNLYSIANQDMGSNSLTLDELYSTLVEKGYTPTIQTLNSAKEDLKCAGLLDGDPRSGYSFTDTHVQ